MEDIPFSLFSSSYPLAFKTAKSTKTFPGIRYLSLGTFIFIDFIVIFMIHRVAMISIYCIYYKNLGQHQSSFSLAHLSLASAENSLTTPDQKSGVFLFRK